MRLFIKKLTLVFVSACIKQSAFTVAVIMPHTYELSWNRIRPDYWELFSGLFTREIFAHICKGQFTQISPANLERALKRISVLVH